jgi:SAM-dependent methyltransferase
LTAMREVTGERLLPDEQRGQLVYAEHVARYRLASQLASGRRILDAACGEGYGTAMMAAAGAARAVGVDIHGRTVAHAREKYGGEFEEGDVCRLPFEDASFDLVVSFETIEHVEDPGTMLAEFRRVLEPAGLLVVSTPNKDEYLIGTEFHVHEFTPAEFTQLLERQFPVVGLLYQQNWLLSAILRKDQFALADGEEPLDAAVSKVAGLCPGKELYTVAVCGDGLEGKLRDIGVVASAFEAHELTHRANEEERQRKAWVERAEEAERLVRSWNERAAEAERQLAEKTETLGRVESSLSWRITKPLRSAKQAMRGTRE